MFNKTADTEKVDVLDEAGHPARIAGCPVGGNSLPLSPACTAALVVALELRTSVVRDPPGRRVDAR